LVRLFSRGLLAAKLFLSSDRPAYFHSTVSKVSAVTFRRLRDRRSSEAESKSNGVDGVEFDSPTSNRTISILEIVADRTRVFTSDAIAIIHEAALGSLRAIDRVATAALRESARRKRKLVERDAVEHVIGVLGV
jgi:hypothetical protein